MTMNHVFLSSRGACGEREHFVQYPSDQVSGRGRVFFSLFSDFPTSWRDLGVGWWLSYHLPCGRGPPRSPRSAQGGRGGRRGRGGQRGRCGAGRDGPGSGRWGRPNAGPGLVKSCPRVGPMQVGGRRRRSRSNFSLRPSLALDRAQAQQRSRVGAEPVPRRNRKFGPG